MLTDKELKEIKDRLAKATPGPWVWEGLQVDTTLQLQGKGKTIISSCTLHFHDAMLIMHAPEYIAALIAEVERLRAIIAANPVMSKSAQKRLTAQVLDATPQRKGYDLAGPENHHSARPEKTF